MEENFIERLGMCFLGALAGTILACLCMLPAIIAKLLGLSEWYYLLVIIWIPLLAVALSYLFDD